LPRELSALPLLHLFFSSYHQSARNLVLVASLTDRLCPSFPRFTISRLLPFALSACLPFFVSLFARLALLCLSPSASPACLLALVFAPPPAVSSPDSRRSFVPARQPFLVASALFSADRTSTMSSKQSTHARRSQRVAARSSPAVLRETSGNEAAASREYPVLNYVNM